MQDLRNRTALPGAAVSVAINGTRRSVQDTLATGSGWFVFATVPAGQHPLTVRRIGYVTLEGPVLIRAGRTDTLVVALNAFGSVYGDLGC